MNADKKIEIVARGEPHWQPPRFRVAFFDQLDLTSFRCFDGRKYRLAARDQAVRRFLLQLSEYQQAASYTGRAALLAFRQDFQRIIAARPIPGLVWCVWQGDAETRRLAIWLLGRIRNRHTLNAITYWRDDADVRVRKEVVRALRRLGAWSRLREIANSECDPVVQRAAVIAQSLPKEFGRRLSRYLGRDVENVSEYYAEGTGPLGVRLETEIGGGLPPKSPHFIRLILDHIRRLVHGDKKEAG